jgi:diadenosine tetraphosphate (Ap4A) HIT family hydrolase
MMPRSWRGDGTRPGVTRLPASSSIRAHPLGVGDQIVACRSRGSLVRDRVGVGVAPVAAGVSTAAAGDLDWERRKEFLFDLSLLGEAVERACRGNGLRRINYEVLGNSIPVLHGHVHARYEWEPPDKIGGPVWRYPKDERSDPAYAYSDARHGELRAAITAELQGLVALAY